MVPKTVRIRRKYFSDLVGSQKEKNFFHLCICHGYINDHQSPFIGPTKKVIENFEKLPPLDHGGPEMKCCNNRNCWKKIA